MSDFESWLHGTHGNLEKNNQSRISLALGPRGSGKSWSGLRLGLTLNGDSFSVKKNVCFFDAWSFADRINTARKGDFLMLDDFGRGLDSREFGKASNIMVSQYLETSRPRNLWLYVSTPSKIFIDVRVRALCDDLVIFSKVNKKTNCAICEWLQPSFDKYGKHTDPFLSSLELRSKEGRYYENESVAIACPPLEIAEEYEALRGEAVARQEAELKEYFSNRGHLLTLPQVGTALRMSAQDLMTMVALNLVKLWREDKVPKIPQTELERLVSELDLRPREIVCLVNPKDAEYFPGKVAKLEHGWSLGVMEVK
jgi:DNA-binding Xre family transcriptional regulator